MAVARPGSSKAWAKSGRSGRICRNESIAIGDTVNPGGRIQSATGVLGVGIRASTATHDSWGVSWR